MKILFVCTDFNRSGAALAMIELAEKIQQYGNVVVLLYPGKGEAVLEAKKRGLDSRIIRSYEWVKPLTRKERLREKIRWLLKHLYNLISIIRISFLIKREKIDIVHNNTLWGYVGAAAAKFTHTPYVWHMRELLEQQQQQLRWEKYGSKLISDADALIAISKLIEDNYKKRFPAEKIHLIYDGVDVAKMFQKNHELFQSSETKIVIIGGVRESKRQLDVVQAVEILINKGADIRLSIVGADNTIYASNIKKYVRSHNLCEYITFHGETSNVAFYWRQNDISVTASQFEAFGRVTAEAMLTGCVVVVSNSGANEEIVNDRKNGYVYELGNPKSLAAVIEEILNNKDKAVELAEIGKKDVVERFGSEKNAMLVLELYNVILKKSQNEGRYML